MGFCSRFAVVGLLLAVHVILSAVFVQAQNTNFTFSSFGTPDLDSFLMVEDVRHDVAGSSFVMNYAANAEANPRGNSTGSCGKLLFKEKVRMQDSAFGAIASFRTAFTFQITGLDSNHSDGLAFTFARNNTLLDETSGSFLCLLKDSNNGMPSNHVFAVEFDTFWNPELNDFSDNHIGVNINSMNSTFSFNLCGGEVKTCTYLWNGGYFTAWIDYNSTVQRLEVFFANGSLYNNIAKPSKPLIDANLSLARLWDDYMYVGFSASTGLHSREVHEIQSWRFSSSGMPEQVAVQPPHEASKSSNRRSKVGVIAVVTAWVAGVWLIMGCFCSAICRCCKTALRRYCYNIALRRYRGHDHWPSQDCDAAVYGNHLFRRYKRCMRRVFYLSYIALFCVSGISAYLYFWSRRAFRCILRACCWIAYRVRRPFKLRRQYIFLDPNFEPVRLFTYKELEKATKNFSFELRSELGAGAVYKGTLRSGTLVTVMRINFERRIGEEGLEARVASLGQIRHRNMVNLRGWCHEAEQLFLVYDYMCNGSLDECLYSRSSKRNEQRSVAKIGYNIVQSLMLRHSVLSDVAAALSYLHNFSTFHGAIKSSNVLLDGDWTAYLADFGLVRFFDPQQLKKTAVIGTLGYIAPELVLHTHIPTTKSDIYSFGVLMLEVMCGTRPLDTSAFKRGEGMLVDRVWRAHEAGNILQMADPRLEAFQLPCDVRKLGSRIGEIEMEEAYALDYMNDMPDVDQSNIFIPDAETVDKTLIANLLHLGLLCCSPDPEDRPPMSLVSEWLQSIEYMEMSLPPLPVRKPQTQFLGPAQDDRIVVAVEKLDSYLKLATECLEAVQKMSDSRKFNNEQCGYLAEKLRVVIQSASLFLDRSRAQCHRPCSSVNTTRLAQNFKLLVALAKQTESFVQGSCKYEWIQAAMTLSNVSEYVSSLGFNLELCKLVFCEETLPGPGHCLTSAEVGDINAAEVEAVKVKAARDQETLLQKVTLELQSLEGENRELAIILQQRLCGVRPNPASDDEMDKLFKWVIPGDHVPLGSGASANVYKAMWLGTPVAKKTFHGLENSEFLKEVEILSQLCHPNITSMFCYAKCSKRTCSIIMELMDEDLNKLMETRCRDGNESQPFTILEAVDIMIQIGEGVNYLHSKRIVHRDLKSMNILVKNVEVKLGEIVHVQAKVTDFGLSKAKDRSTTYSNQTFNTGTSRWMPPEVIKLTSDSRESGLSKHEKLPKYPFKCDTYSFGMVCYEILAGSVPFSDINSPSEIKRRVIMNHERPILPGNCPAKLKVLIERCWSQEPKKRPKFEAICLELKYVKYLLMTGYDS